MNALYLLESPMGAVEIVAADDLSAAVEARSWLCRHGFDPCGYQLFRAPEGYVERATAGLIWVPIFSLMPKAKP